MSSGEPRDEYQAGYVAGFNAGHSKSDEDYNRIRQLGKPIKEAIDKLTWLQSKREAGRLPEALSNKDGSGGSKAPLPDKDTI